MGDMRDRCSLPGDPHLPPGVTFSDLEPVHRSRCGSCGAEIQNAEYAYRIDVTDEDFCDAGCAADWIADHADLLARRFRE